jgi:SAM-dependent methyltransferase
MTAQLETALLRLARAVQATGYAFVTPTPATHARMNARPGAEWARDLRDVFGWSRPFRPDVIPAPVLDAMHAADALAPAPGGYRSRVRFSTLDGLLFAHSAYPTVEADAVFFGPDTYRFARAIRAHRQERVRRAVDIGCGAGPGAILLARAYPEADVIGVDINDAALRMTRANAALAGVPVQAVHSDLLGAVDGLFDLIVANPPYLIDPAARSYRHGGGELGAGLSHAIIEAALERLAPGGSLLLYTGSAIVGGEDVFRARSQALLSRPGWVVTYDEIDPDVFGEELEHGAYAVADRIAAVLVTATKAG